MDVQKRIAQTGVTRRLNLGIILRELTKRTRVSQRAKENAICTAALSVESGDMFKIIRSTVQNIEHKSPLPSLTEFYKTCFFTLLECVQNAPSCEVKERRVEIHHHYRPETVKTGLAALTLSDSESSTQSTKASVKRTALWRGSSTTPSGTVVGKKVAPSAETSAKSGSADKRSRKRIRFARTPIRQLSDAPWACPESLPNCSVCADFWSRRFKCRYLEDCAHEHLDGAHVKLNSVELRMIRGQHPGFKALRAGNDAQVEPSGSPLQSAPESDSGWQPQSPSYDPTPSSATARKRVSSWASDVESPDPKRLHDASE